ncbi:MAG: SPOR domain-containing protein [Gammaproteobacteria bacterium]
MEQNLKQRLVGAVVLISLAVIFLPLVFDGQQQRIDTAPYAIPEKPVISIVAPDVKPLEQAVAEHVQAVSAVQADKAAQESQGDQFDHQPVSVAPSEESPAVASASPDKATEAYLVQEKKVDQELQGKPVEQTVDLAEAWMIQVGAFSSRDNAMGLQDKLKAGGYPAFVRTSKGASSTLYKVYVGPEIRRAHLESQKAELEAKFKLKALILKYIP